MLSLIKYSTFYAGIKIPLNAIMELHKSHKLLYDTNDTLKEIPEGTNWDDMLSTYLISFKDQIDSTIITETLTYIDFNGRPSNSGAIAKLMDLPEVPVPVSGAGEIFIRICSGVWCFIENNKALVFSCIVFICICIVFIFTTMDMDTSNQPFVNDHVYFNNNSYCKVDHNPADRRSGWESKW
jgi:hypothetical protein